MRNFEVHLREQLATEETRPSKGKKAREIRKQSFKDYLIVSGVQGDLAKCLMMLYKERVKPRDAVDYVRSRIGVPRISPAQYNFLKEQLQLNLHRIKELEGEIELVKDYKSLDSLVSNSSYSCMSVERD